MFFATLAWALQGRQLVLSKIQRGNSMLRSGTYVCKDRPYTCKTDASWIISEVELLEVYSDHITI